MRRRLVCWIPAHVGRVNPARRGSCAPAVIFIIVALSLIICGCREREAEQLQAPLTFLFFSDTQAEPEIGDYSSLGELLSRAVLRKAETAPKLIIFGGDTVNDGADAAEWQRFWQTAAAPLVNLTTLAAAGNHDSQALLAEQFDYPQQAPSGQGEGFFYSFDAEQVHFVMLDSNIMGAANPADIEWLRADLQSEAARQAVWRIAVMHHPIWPVVENPKDAARAVTIRERFLPLLQTGGVDLILCGHQLVFARSMPMQGESASDDGSGIIQIMAASGAKESYIAANRDYLAALAPAPNYLLLQADSAALTVTAYDERGEAFDICVLAR
jgi:3',5'-cyclic AMP phosphodiesterase CpdA